MQSTRVFNCVYAALVLAGPVSCEQDDARQAEIRQGVASSTTVKSTGQKSPSPAPALTPQDQPPKAAPAPPPPADLPARPGVVVNTTPVRSAAEARKRAWLTEEFRCRAISTVRFRKCRFEETGTGHRLAFQKRDVVCDDVSFDENGDPRELVGCRSSWLKVPASNRLKTDRNRTVWSGSHKGWRWKGDGERYCCPGLWLEAPKSLSRQ